ncbi:uncharacterized protein LOC113306055 [Papaver somniferum]|uniref:uncharacterized protein LOC113306055 n=1 Tax=Papaver somniferum TaxID=3469 RepID=UPI000E6FA5C0|nr:uncharacterized protein LOC113306055 [Papaver somniferum]
MYFHLIDNSYEENKGNIWILWSDSINPPSIISNTKQEITVEVGDALIAGVHAATLTVNRRELWKDLEDINNLNKPWLVIGDFNTMMIMEEKKGGLAPLKISMMEFKNCLNICGLIQAPSTGLHFSWCNNRAGRKRIVCNLDRAVFNDKWLELFPSWGYKVGERGRSDHGVLYGANTEIPKPKNVPFRALKGFNAYFLLLLPKVKNVKRSNQFRPIRLMNFGFKEITKIVTTRIGNVIQKVISPQQGAFIKGRNIQEQIVLSSELINEIDVKMRGGNLGLKLDITQAYDSLSWDFLFQVMRNFGFSEKGIKWIHTLLQSARISVLLHGGLVGYFKVGIGLRQGDLMYPILFVIAEDLLIRTLSRMIQDRTIQPMVSGNGVQPSHILFADDIFLFCNGDKRNIRKLLNFLRDYQMSSGQRVNFEKSKCFIGGTSELRKVQLENDCNMPLSTFPDKYLGVMLTPGCIKSSHIWGYVEQIQENLVGWKGKLLSFQERLILVKHILCSIPIYNMSAYKWPKKVIQDVVRMIRNLLWTGDPSTTKMHNSEMGLFWKDAWVKERALKDIFPRNEYMLNFPEMKVSDLLLEGEWVIPTEILDMLHQNDLPVISTNEDKRIWYGTITGDFTVASAVECIRRKFPKLFWTKKVWSSSVHPSISSNIWKLFRGITPTNDKMKSRKFKLASRCIFCKKSEENINHILWHCDFSEIIWKWLGGIFCFLHTRSYDEMLTMAKHKSPAIKELWKISSFITMKEIWFQRNRCVYDKDKVNVKVIQYRIVKLTSEYEIKMKAHMWNTAYDLQILKSFGLKCKKIRSTKIQEIFFKLPQMGQILLCCDGASQGNLGAARYEFISRNNEGECIVAFEGSLGIATNYNAEVLAIICAGEWAIHKGYTHLIFQSDSQAVIEAFKSHRIPWFAINRWNKICRSADDLSLCHCYREINFSADTLAKRGSRLDQG